MSIVCPNCLHKEIEGALFCSECGTKLVDEDGLSTATISTTDSNIDLQGTENDPKPSAPTPAIDAMLSLHIMRTGQILPLIGKEEFSIGRVSEGQSILPDIDLTPYDAFSQGVSRLHSTIKIRGNEVYITDLGSSNGTRINKERIASHTENLLKHGDEIAIGRFKIQVLIRQDD